MENTKRALLELEKVSKYYKNADNVSLGLHNVSTKLNLNEIVAITGQSGSGKSTFLNVITGVDSYEEGELFFKGESTSYFSKEDLEKYRRENVGFVFQNYNLVDSYTVKQNVMFPLLLKGMETKESEEEAIRIIEKVGLSNRIHHKATKLSGGEKQRCVIARALASDSQILACDEPTGNLDSKTSAEIINLIHEVAKDRLVLIVTHNYEEVEHIATRKLRFSDGELVEDRVLINTDIVEYEEDKEVDGDSNLRRKELFKIAFQNLISTPKKTIFSLIVLLISCFAVAAIYTGIVSSISENNKSMISMPSEAGLLERSPSRVMLVSESGQPIDLNAIDKSIDITSSKSVLRNRLEDYQFYSKSDVSSDMLASIKKDSISLLTFFSVSVEIPEKTTNLVGSTIINDNEIFINASVFDYQSLCSYVDSKIIISFGKDFSKEYLLKGVNQSTNTYSTIIDPNGSIIPAAYSTYINNNISFSLSYQNSKIAKYSNGFEIKEINVSNDNTTYKDDIVYINSIDVAGSTVSFAEEAALSRLEYSLNDNSFQLNNKIEFLSDASMPEGVYLNKETYDKIVNDNNYLLSFYNISKESLNSKISSDTLNVVTPKDFESVNLNSISITIENTAQIIGGIFYVLVIFFIAYLVLSKIYKSKNKDYTMLRTLGTSKNQMASIVSNELSYITVLSVIIAIVAAKILGATINNSFFEAFNTLNLGQYILFVVIFIFFGWLISSRFNKKLFKYSINSTLKREEFKRD